MKRRFWKITVTLAIPALWMSAWQSMVRADTPPAPILVIVDDAAPNKFSGYLAEILRAEGLNAFAIIDVDSLTAGELAKHDLAILAETPLSPAQATVFSDYVGGGGRLLALRPDAQLNSLFGLDASAGVLNDGYLRFDAAAVLNGTTPAGGLTPLTLQIHGNADRYSTLPGSVTLAQLYSSSSTATPYPAVVAGSSGRAVAFTYDLARNVVYTRQGNPANANLDIDGDGVLRTIDLFQTPGNGAPWVDRDRIAVPQADEQQRFFARLVMNLVGQAKPLPQLWYFPDSAKTMLVLTGDAHANPSEYYTSVISDAEAYGGRLTFYISIAAEPDDGQVQTWRGQGHEFGIHPYAYKDDPYPPFNITSLVSGYAVYDGWYSSVFSSPKSRTVRNHQVAWLGWTDAAEIAVSHGIALDTDFYHWGPWLQKLDGSWPHGYITGSGQPMKFVRADGTILPIYQQLTQLVDEQLLLDVVGAGFEGLNAAQAFSVSQQLIDASLAGDHAAIMTQFHVDYYPLGGPQFWAQATMAYAQSLGVPIWNADRWLSFTETRNDARYSNIEWSSATHTLTFTLNATATDGINLTTMLPMSYQGATLQSVTVDGAPHAFGAQTIKGASVAFLSVSSGNHVMTAHYISGAALAVSKSPDAQTVRSGSTVTFTIAVTNTGVASLSNVQVGDMLAPNCNAALGTLNAGASSSYTCTRANAANSFVNVAVVSGTPPIGPSISSSDSAAVTVIHPSIAVAKSPTAQIIQSGSTVTFAIAVTNTGDALLSSVQVSDALAPNCSATLGALAAGASTSYACARANVTSNFTNTAIVSGTPAVGPIVSASDSANVTVIHPSIAIAKSPDAQTVHSGSTVTFTITVTNTGDTTLSGVHVDDLPAPNCNATLGTIAAGAASSYDCTLANVTESFTNTAIVSGAPPVGSIVFASDNAAVTVIHPAIAIAKSQDAQMIQSGSAVTFAIAVTNTGDVALTNVQVSDVLTPDCNAIFGTLASGAKRSYTCTQVNVTNSFVNTAVVTGTPTVGPDVFASDTAEVTVIHPSITVSKSPDNQIVASGSTVTFTIAITNSGDSQLTNVQVSDALTPNCNTVLGTLATGVSTSYTCTRANITSSFINTVVVSGTPVVGPNVSATDNATVSVVNPVPAINSLSPMTITAGGPAFTLTIQGAGFVAASAIHWQGQPIDTSFISSTQLLGQVAAARIAVTGTATITVSNPAPGGGISNTAVFTITALPQRIVFLPALMRGVSAAPSAERTMLDRLIRMRLSARPAGHDRDVR